jgi:histone H3/H4
MSAAEIHQPTADQGTGPAMRLSLAGRFGRRARLSLLVAALAAAAVAAWLAPPLALVALAAAAAVALWDRAALDRDLRALAAAVTSGAPGAKLEVTDGAWGELCHALNRLQQQRRAQRQVETLLPALPVARAARLADAGVPAEGLRCEVAVLALARPASLTCPAAHLRETAEVALLQARRHEALLARSDDRFLLIFGALEVQSPAANLRAARQAAAELHAAWAAVDGGPRLSLAAGTARAVVLPGLGLTVIGTPVEQAVGLQELAGPASLVCNEDAYLGLRRIGAVPPQPLNPRLATPDERPAYSISL